MKINTPDRSIPLSRVSGSLVLYGNSDGAFLESIDSFIRSPEAGELVIVDNSPSDVLLGLIRERYPDEFKTGLIKYYSRPDNPGYGSSHNQAFDLRSVSTNYHVILNPDVAFSQQLIGKLADFMDSRPDAGMVMPKIVNRDGTTQYLCKRLPTPWDLFIRRFIPLAVGLRKSLADYELRYTGYDHIMNPPSLSGCFMFLRVSDFSAVGRFDERFFMYMEDLDLSRRIHAIKKTLFFPEAKVIHDHGRASYKSLRMTFVHAWNLFKYFNKWGWFFDDERRKMNKALFLEENPRASKT